MVACGQFVGSWWLVDRVQSAGEADLRVELFSRAQLVTDGLAVVQAAIPTVREVRLRRLTGTENQRVSVLSEDGQTVWDSHPNAPRLVDEWPLDQIRAGLADGRSETQQASAVFDERAQYVAVPANVAGSEGGYVVVSAPLSRAATGRLELVAALAAVGLCITAGAGAVSLWMARRVTSSVRRVARQAEQLADGDVSQPLEVSHAEECEQLVISLNRIAEQLRERMDAVTREEHEREAVLSSVAEGVLAVDTDYRVMSLNRVACSFLGLQSHSALGRRLDEVIRNSDLRRFVDQVLAADASAGAELLLALGAGRLLKAQGTALRDGQGRATGAVIVLNDVTRLRKLESLRREFVANVSHELKTPVTSIQGFVETLLDGALADGEAAERFLRIIARQADRLNSIIDDLLSLSKIERDAQAGEIALEVGPILEVLQAALVDCQVKADERQIELVLDCAAGLSGRINARLLEQAVTNLVDNAVKYSEPGHRVLVETRAEGGELAISVRDQGCGISAQHLERVFERFYRVDKARSRSAGGTGLGLSIVKHIVHAHGGRVSVESQVGQGSVFTIHLPAVDSPAENAEPLAETGVGTRE
jgi:two-component system phosphate regulon sensor histidine kinase PhoR